MTHIWLRAESRDNEARAPITAQAAAALIAAGFQLTVEESRQRVLALDGYRQAGARIVPEGRWRHAPKDAWILGLKELPEDGSPLIHRHIMFGHAYKGQPAGQTLLRRFAAGGGALLDLEYLVDETGRRLAAFGTWAGFAGAAVAVQVWAAQQAGGLAGPAQAYPSAQAMADEALSAVAGRRPTVIIIGAVGRVGRGATDLCHRIGIEPTLWDIAETRHGGPFPELLAHDIFLNCILARPGCPVFVPRSALAGPRQLSVIGDIACDPTSDFSPIKVYDRATDWQHPALRVATDPVLDVTAIDNLPSMLPAESSADFSAQLLPVLMTLDRPDQGAWGRASDLFRDHLHRLKEAAP